MPSAPEDAWRILRYHARSFRWACLFLSATRRQETAIVYAFCRYVDDLVDEATSRIEALAALARVQRVILNQSDPYPLEAAFCGVLDRHRVDRRVVMELLKGLGHDLDEVLIRDDRALLRYCYRVAGTVGVMMSTIFKANGASAHLFAIDLGIAMQLTNICRDVYEDAQRGRVYLPESRFREHGLSHAEADLLNASGRPNNERLSGSTELALQSVVRGLIDLAEEYYRSAEKGLPALPPGPRLAVVVASRLYRGIGLRLLRFHRANPWHQRTRLPTWAKVWGIVTGTFRWIRTFSKKNRVLRHDADLHRHLDGLPYC